MDEGFVIQVGGDKEAPTLTPEEFVDAYNKATGQNFKYEGFEEFMPDVESVIGPAGKAVDEMKNRIKSGMEALPNNVKETIEKMKDDAALVGKGMMNDMNKVSGILSPFGTGANGTGARINNSPGVIQTLEPIVTKSEVEKREVEKFVESSEGDKLIIASDDTIWLLKDGKWIELKDAVLPPLPQNNP